MGFANYCILFLFTFYTHSCFLKKNVVVNSYKNISLSITVPSKDLQLLMISNYPCLLDIKNQRSGNEFYCEL